MKKILITLLVCLFGITAYGQLKAPTGLQVGRYKAGSDVHKIDSITFDGTYLVFWTNGDTASTYIKYANRKSIWDVILAETATATSDGTGTGILELKNQDVTVTSSNTDYIICLPAISASYVGLKITGQVGSTGFELRVAASQATTVYLNNVTTNVEATIPANTVFEVTCVDATHWVLKAWTMLGAVITAIIPDAI
jgi:hypothetical protein